MGEYVVPPVSNDTPEKDVENVIANEDEPMETEKVEDISEKADIVSDENVRELIALHLKLRIHLKRLRLYPTMLRELTTHPLNLRMYPKKLRLYPKMSRELTT